MGLVQADTTAIKRGYQATMDVVSQAVVGAGAWFWQGFSQSSLPPASAGVDVCDAWFRAGVEYAKCAYMQEVSSATQRPLPAVEQDLAAFLIVRGPHAWLGYGWVGCVTEYEFPDAWLRDYGTPITPYFNSSGSVHSREWTKATATFDCATWTGTVTMK